MTAGFYVVLGVLLAGGLAVVVAATTAARPVHDPQLEPKAPTRAPSARAQALADRADAASALESIARHYREGMDSRRALGNGVIVGYLTLCVGVVAAATTMAKRVSDPRDFQWMAGIGLVLAFLMLVGFTVQLERRNWRARVRYTNAERELDFLFGSELLPERYTETWLRAFAKSWASTWLVAFALLVTIGSVWIVGHLKV